LYIELAAACAMVDEVHPDIPTPEHDSNNHTLGSIQQHNVVIVCLPAAGYGNINAASVMTNLVRTFTCIRVGLMVGIGGGAPNPRNDVRLGDIVVGTRVMLYELAKMVPGGQVQHTDVQRAPKKLLTTLLSKVRAEHEANPSRILTILEERFARMPDYHHPNLPDDLYQATYKHENMDALVCSDCDQTRIVARITRESLDPKIHYGGIASGDKVVKDGLAREDMARKFDAICFEMEAAGVMSIIPCLPIRDICDYSDSHKNKGWQKFAAAIAAAYARELLETLSLGSIHSDQSYELTRTQSVFSRSFDENDTTEQTLSVDKLARRRDLMASLQFEQIDSRRINIEPAYDKTCEWFLQSSSYLKWQDSEQLPAHHGFLWIRGKPGAGKSTMMKYLYN
jgi:nucleoside phosphorylase